MKIVNAQIKFPKAPLQQPDAFGYIHLALEIENSSLPLYFRTSERKRKIIARVKTLVPAIQARADVLDVSVFKGIVKPPLNQPYLEEVRDQFHVARYDLVILVQTRDLRSARAAARGAEFAELQDYIEEQDGFSHCIVAENARRIADVDRKRPGVFLFNYFYGQDIDDVMGVWEYTAGWFTTNTGLDNSTLFRPVSNQKSQYTVINHCRWDSLIRLMPSLLFKKTLDTYVMANFAANRTAVMPILYRLA